MSQIKRLAFIFYALLVIALTGCGSSSSVVTLTIPATHGSLVFTSSSNGISYLQSTFTKGTPDGATLISGEHETGTKACSSSFTADGYEYEITAYGQGNGGAFPSWWCSTTGSYISGRLSITSGTWLVTW
jgi:hypothetical protein